MGTLFGARRYTVFCVLVSAVGGLMAARIALGTPYNVHPDEFIHVDAFCYFDSNAWLPPLNWNGLNYGPESESRVYDNEIVYWVDGRAGAGLEWLSNLAAPATAPSQPVGPTAQLSADHTRCLPHYVSYRP